MADIRKILKEHVADLVPADGVVHCRGDELTFDSMEAFGRHVDALLSRPPRSRGRRSPMRWPPIWANWTRCPRSRSPSRSATTVVSDAAVAGPAPPQPTRTNGGSTWPTPFSKRWGGSNERRGRVRRRRRSARPVRGPGALRARPCLPRRGRLVPRPGRRGHDGGGRVRGCRRLLRHRRPCHAHSRQLCGLRTIRGLRRHRRLVPQGRPGRMGASDERSP